VPKEVEYGFGIERNVQQFFSKLSGLGVDLSEFQEVVSQNLGSIKNQIFDLAKVIKDRIHGSYDAANSEIKGSYSQKLTHCKNVSPSEHRCSKRLLRAKR
jgi:hypothetical protein